MDITHSQIPPHYTKIINYSIDNDIFYRLKNGLSTIEQLLNDQRENINVQDFYTTLLIFAVKIQDIKIVELLIDKIEQPEQLFNTYQNSFDSALFIALNHKNVRHNTIDANIILDLIKSKTFESKVILIKEHENAIQFSLNSSPNPAKDIHDFILPWIEEECCNKIIGNVHFETM